MQTLITVLAVKPPEDHSDQGLHRSLSAFFLKWLYSYEKRLHLLLYMYNVVNTTKLKGVQKLWEIIVPIKHDEKSNVQNNKNLLPYIC